MLKARTIWICWLLAGCCWSGRGFGAEPDGIVSDWLRQQTNVQSWSADFTQTRTIKALAQPLVSTGRVWFAAPDNFRWELGKDQTIAIRNGETMLVIYPRLRRAERYQLDAGSRSEWKDALGLLQSGFPRSRQELDRQFRIVAATPMNDLVELHLEPKSPGARKLMPRINLFLIEERKLAGTELVFADGSAMRNDFRNARTNAVAGGLFELTVPAGFKLTEPLRERRR